MPMALICCSLTPKVEDRPLITDEQADGVEDMFKILVNGVRLQILLVLIRTSEISVGQ